MLRKIDKKNLGLTVSLFLIFAFFIYLFPYSGDDWAWGCKVGLERLQNNFDNYNGRYVGNLLVMVLTRSKFINMLFTAASLVCVCQFPKIFSSSKSILPYLFGTALFFLIPKAMLEQTVVWTSGFTNYVPSILLIFLYLILIKDIFEKTEQPKYHWTTHIIVFFIGFTSSLFMENVTLYSVAVSVLIIAFTIYKYKKIFLINLLYFISSVIGTCIMFSNSAYSTIAKGEDFYRTSGFNINTILEQSKIIFQHYVENNFFLLLIFSSLCAVVYFIYTKTCNDKKYNTLAFLSLLSNFILLFIIFQKKEFTGWVLNIDYKDYAHFTTIVFVLVAILYFATAAVVLLIGINSKSVKTKALLLLISIPILIAPLVVVTPIGPRCLFPPFFLLIALCVLLFSYIQTTITFNKVTKSSIATVSLTYIAASLIFLSSIFTTIHAYDNKRIDYIRRQIDAGYTTVKVCKLPFYDYVWFGDPTPEAWERYFKLFYGIDTDIDFEFLTFGKFNNWAEDFEKEIANR